MTVKNTVLPVQSTLQSRGRLLDLSKPVAMGILNATPNSFYNKGRGNSIPELVDAAGRMLEQGATILDVGGTSTKPGAAISNADEECSRILPVIEAICKAYPNAWLSLDTYHAKVAREGVLTGVAIINDVSSGNIDNAMLATVAELKVPYITMHMQGIPETMQRNPSYGDVLAEVRDYLRVKCDVAESVGITDIIVDPGFGFGKTLEHNYELLRGMHTMRMLGKPILAGISRKSIVCKALGVSPEHALNGTTALHMVALQQGASILRVHDVKEAMEVIRLFEYLSS
jgi:dihydropteroate synthase